ncbi:hypothetical protein [Geobacter grbiciae]|uniref:hypothetical protein n=1 Tax=Geobacter grbiciae TaxID=155042 RepID=UPI001C01F1C3|nr:hypothetical protein [Geobacter grbiciae]MBT1075620.1 hypothetical protein [Geobacter grbiciae]
MKASAAVTKRGNPRLLLTGLVLLAALAAGSGPVYGGPPPAPSGALSSQPGVPADLLPEIPDPDGFVTVEVGDYFTCDIPPDWSRFDNYGSGFGLSNEEKKTYGFYLNAPSQGGIPVTMAIFYYAEGNLMYKSVDRYIRTHAPLEGSNSGGVKPAMVAGRKGMVFESVRSQIDPGSLGNAVSDDPRVHIRPGLNARRLSVRERFMVLPAKPGFYALRYTAPEGKFREFLPVFEKVTQRFFPGGRYINQPRDTERGTSHDYGHEVY